MKLERPMGYHVLGRGLRFVVFSSTQRDAIIERLTDGTRVYLKPGGGAADVIDAADDWGSPFEIDRAVGRFEAEMTHAA